MGRIVISEWSDSVAPLGLVFRGSGSQGSLRFALGYNPPPLPGFRSRAGGAPIHGDDTCSFGPTLHFVASPRQVSFLDLPYANRFVLPGWSAQRTLRG